MPASTLSNRIYRFGEFRLLADDRMLLRGETRIPMSPRVFELLLVLVENSGRLISKETLMNRIWEDSFVEEGNLNQTVSRLRKILGERPNQNRFIETIPRVGYRFIADVEVDDDGSPKLATPSPRGTEEETDDRERSFAINPRRTVPWKAIAVLSVLIAGIGIPLLWSFFPRSDVANNLKSPKQTPVRLTNNPTREERPTFTRDGEVRFLRWQGDQPAMFLMSADGANQRREVGIKGLKTGAWSPDGRKVIFFKEGDESESIYLSDSDGSNEIKLPFIAGNLGWAPDSSTFLYQSGKTDSDIFLYTIASGKSTNVVARPGFDSDPAFSPDGKTVVFVSDRDGNAEIYSQDVDGSNLRRLTNHPAHDEFPTFSPDGTQIVFNSNREEENFDVWIMNSDGSALRKLTVWKSDEEIRPGCWSPDGTQLLFASNKDGKPNIYKMDIEPFTPRQVLGDRDRGVRFPAYSRDGDKLLYVADNEDETGELHVVELKGGANKTLLKLEDAEAYPTFSPDGKWILLQNRVAGNAEVCVIGVDGGEVRNLTNNPARDAYPAWSPDGSKIVFTSNREGNYDVFSIYTMNADGSNVHRIYFSNAISSFPSWSPDGKSIVFSNDKEDGRSGNFELFVIEPETVNPERRLTFRRKYDIQPAFSPDGSRIAFSSNTDGNYEIYVMNYDGSMLVRLTRDLADDMGPAWTPDGKRVVFTSNRDGYHNIYEVWID